MGAGIREQGGRDEIAPIRHPHDQIWASSFIPRLPAREEAAQCEYAQKVIGLDAGYPFNGVSGSNAE